MTRISIRRTQLSDFAALKLIASETELFPPELLPDMAREGKAAGQVWLTAHDPGQCLGFCFARPEEMTIGTWNMLALGVLPAFQGCGVGKRLVTRLEDLLRSAGHRLLLVDTSGDPAYEGARRFYRALGYRQVAEIPDYWAVDDAKLTFAKTLI